METRHHAIPTTYKGVNFRSRLEAKWACMFDQLGWRWTYEPIDLAGWIPDFVIQGVKPILVEVKPIFEFDEALGDEIVRAAGHSACSARDRCDRGCSGVCVKNEYETLICGAILPECAMGDPAIGWLWEHWWAPARVFELNEERGGYGLCHDDATWADRITGLYAGDQYLGSAADLAGMWPRRATRCSGVANLRPISRETSVRFGICIARQIAHGRPHERPQ
jgi:hypothetical protein